MKNKKETYNVQSPTMVACNSNHSSGYRVYFTGTKEECNAYCNSSEFRELQKPLSYKSRGIAVWPVSFLKELS